MEAMQQIPAKFTNLDRKLAPKTNKPQYEINFDKKYANVIGIHQGEKNPVILNIAGREYNATFSYTNNPLICSLAKLVDIESENNETIGTLLHTKLGVPDNFKLTLTLLLGVKLRKSIIDTPYLQVELPPAAVPSTFKVSRGVSGGGFGDPEQNRIVEAAAMCHANAYYCSRGWTTQDVSAEKIGYDITCRRNGEVAYVEVKGVSGPLERFIITANEFKAAESNPDFQLCVVCSATSKNPVISVYTAVEFLHNFLLAPLQYMATRK